jgi:hypothetical protein
MQTYENAMIPCEPTLEFVSYREYCSLQTTLDEIKRFPENVQRLFSATKHRNELIISKLTTDSKNQRRN